MSNIPKIITDWIPFESPSSFELSYRRVENRIEVMAHWADTADQYDPSLPGHLILDMARNPPENLWPSGIKVIVDSVLISGPHVDIHYSPGPGDRYLKEVEWSSSAEVVGWGTSRSDLIWRVPITGKYIIGGTSKAIFLEEGTELSLIPPLENGTVVPVPKGDKK